MLFLSPSSSICYLLRFKTDSFGFADFAVSFSISTRKQKAMKFEKRKCLAIQILLKRLTQHRFKNLEDKDENILQEVTEQQQTTGTPRRPFLATDARSWPSSSSSSSSREDYYSTETTEPPLLRFTDSISRSTRY